MHLFKKQKNLPKRRTQPYQEPGRATEESLEQRYTFKRNRTLTGSVSSRVVSTNEARAELKSPRVETHELTRKRRHIGAVLFLVLIGAAILYGMIAQFTARVIVRSDDPAIKLDSATYETAIQDYFTTQPLERLRFLVNTHRLSDYLQTKTPEVARVEVDGSAGFGASRFVLTMRQPIAGWSMRGQQEYVDASGTAFSRNYFTAPAVQIVDNSGIEVEAGQAVTSNRFLAFVGRAVGLAGGQGYKVNQVIIPTNTTRQVELRLESIPYPIKLSVDRGVGEQIEDMARALGWLKAHNQTPQYLDVRVSGKSYYR